MKLKRLKPLCIAQVTAKAVRHVPVKSPRYDPDENPDDDEETKDIPIKTASAKFLENLDLDDDEDIDPDFDDASEPVVTLAPQEQRNIFANPCIEPDDSTDDELDCIVSEEPKHKPVKAASNAAVEHSEDEAEVTRTTQLVEFTQIVGRTLDAQPMGIFIPTSKEVALTAQPNTSSSVLVSQSTNSSPRIQASDAELKSKAIQLMRDGMNDASIAIKLGMTINTVLDIRREFAKLSKVNNPRELFTQMVDDLSEAFEVAKNNFYDNSQSDINYKAMTEFSKSLRETMSAYQDLDDPAEQATDIIKRIVQPLLMACLNDAVATMSRYKDDVVAFVPEHVKKIAEAGLATHIRKLNSSTTDNYNKAVATLESILNVDLSTQRLHTSMEVQPSTTEIKDG